MYPCGEATSFHCYPCSVEIDSLPSSDGSEPRVIEGELGRYDRQKLFFDANPGTRS
jgi:hypothetical protein